MTGYPPGGAYQQPPAGYMPVPQQKLRPGRVWYAVALLIFVAAAAWLVYGVVSLAGTVDGLQRVPLPAGGTVNLSHSGGYIVYYEGPDAQSGRIPLFHINVAPASPGAAASSLTRYGSDVTYNFGSHHGRAVLNLRIAQPGKFLISTSGVQVSGADLAIGGSIARGIVGVVLPSVPLMALALLGGVLVLVIRLIRKRTVRPAYPFAPG